MACPKRKELAQRRNHLKVKVTNSEPTEYSKYLALKYDIEHNSLPLFKLKEYEKLREKYETKL